jgi:hypothetical protein
MMRDHIIVLVEGMMNLMMKRTTAGGETGGETMIIMKNLVTLESEESMMTLLLTAELCHLSLSQSLPMTSVMLILTSLQLLLM